jgi:hypothetical protein
VSVAHGASGRPVPDDVIARLTEIAAWVAGRHRDPKPTWAGAVATTRNKALEVLANYGPQTIPGEPGTVPVYAVAMTGTFISPRARGRRGAPGPRTWSSLHIVMEASTLEARDVGVRNWEPGAALSRLGPVTQLTW